MPKKKRRRVRVVPLDGGRPMLSIKDAEETVYCDCGGLTFGVPCDGFLHTMIRYCLSSEHTVYWCVTSGKMFE